MQSCSLAIVDGVPVLLLPNAKEQQAKNTDPSQAQVKIINIQKRTDPMLNTNRRNVSDFEPFLGRVRRSGDGLVESCTCRHHRPPPHPGSPPDPGPLPCYLESSPYPGRTLSRDGMTSSRDRGGALGLYADEAYLFPVLAAVWSDSERKQAADGPGKKHQR